MRARHELVANRVGGLLKEGSAAPVTVNLANMLGIEPSPRIP